MKNRYFIFDCMGRIHGNPAGYKTVRGVKIAYTRQKGSLWEIYEKEKKDGNLDITHVCSWKLC